MRYSFATLVVGTAIAGAANLADEVQLERYEETVQDCCLRGTGVLPNLSIESIEPLIQFVRKQANGRSMAYVVVREDASISFARPKPHDGWTYRLWLEKYQERLRLFKGKHLEIVLTPTSGRVRLIHGHALVHERKVSFGVASRIDQFIIGSLNYMHVFKDLWPGTPAAILYLRISSAMPVREILTQELVLRQPIQIIARSDQCFGIDQYYPWVNPFVNDISECDSDSSRLIGSDSCTWKADGWDCRREKYGREHGSANR